MYFRFICSLNSTFKVKFTWIRVQKSTHIQILGSMWALGNEWGFRCALKQYFLAFLWLLEPPKTPFNHKFCICVLMKPNSSTFYLENIYIPKKCQFSDTIVICFVKFSWNHEIWLSNLKRSQFWMLSLEKIIAPINFHLRSKDLQKIGPTLI